MSEGTIEMKHPVLKNHVASEEAPQYSAYRAVSFTLFSGQMHFAQQFYSMSTFYLLMIQYTYISIENKHQKGNQIDLGWNNRFTNGMDVYFYIF